MISCNILLLSIVVVVVQSSSVTLNTVGKCLGDLTTQELAGSYNYLQLSSKLGTTNAYPGFSSLFIKLSEDDASKAHEIVKFLALRKIKLDRLVNAKGVSIRDEITKANTIDLSLKEARQQNTNALKIVQRCHQDANNINEANIQDYLESHLLEYHIKIDKLLEDFQHRLDDAEAVDKQLTIFMLDEELLNTYGDQRKDIFA
ncbi:unnamed protein product [Adineta steineri]|uniref:Ferritin-like diiron domain-containing protein n=1 Tax=Adineta steineri TaxID=433720 RepID=A0A818ZAJ3_9BILA|nr:unnamed protein product [Adineta steineri]CAF3764298.1 unnamed protein product [Adineta steineri]